MKGGRMALKEYQVRAEVVRKTIDPFFNPKIHGSQVITYYSCFFDINRLIPKMMDMPIKNANPRNHENLTNTAVRRDIRDEYLNDDSMFHLKNSGITMNVKYVDEVGDGILRIVVDEDEEKRHGIMNGGTTFTVLKNVISELQQDGYDLPRNKYVKVEIRVGMDPKTVPSISEGLNTHASVTKASLLALDNKFDFIKNALSKETYADRVSYRQYEDGDVDVTRLLQYMTALNIHQYGKEDDNHPIKSYSGKSSCVTAFEKKEADYQSMSGILPDILKLVDEIKLQAYSCTANLRSSKYVIAAKNKNDFSLLTKNEVLSHNITDSILFPILGAFRCCLVSGDNQLHWRKPFNQVLGIFDAVAPKMFRKINKIYKEVGDVNQVAKLSSTWESMQDILNDVVEKELRKVA